MRALLLALQVSVGPSQQLGVAREALERADTVAAVATLTGLASDRWLTSEGVAALFLLRWIGWGPTQDSAAVASRREAQRRIEEWEQRESAGAIAPDPRVDFRVTILWIERVLDTGRGLEHLAFILAPCPGDARDALGRHLPASQLACGDWRVALDSTAARSEQTDPMLAGALWWIRLRSVLRSLDSIAETPPRVSDTARCGALVCMRLANPPPDVRLLAVFAHDDAARGDLQELGNLFGRLARAPWPFDALAARAHLTVCALLRAPAGTAGCWPTGDGLTGRDAAEVRALAPAFRGQHALAGKVMDEAPAYFTALDEARDVVDPGGSACFVERPGLPPLPIQSAQCAGRAAAEGRMPVDVFWRAAWPLYLEPYNERLVVHRARLLLADYVVRLGARERPLFFPVGDPTLIVRGGVPLAVVEGQPVPVGGQTRRASIAYYPRGMHETVVRTGALGQWVSLNLALVARGWSDRSAATGFAAESYDAFGPLDHQLVHYVRDGRRQVDIYTRWGRDPTCRDVSPVLGLYLLDDRMREITRAMALDLEERPRKRFHLTLEPRTYVYSLELLDRACRRAERARYVIQVPPVEGALLSDLMLADELHYGDSHRAADRLYGLMPATISPGTAIMAGGTARFYWEMYGVSQDTLTARRLEVHFEVVNVEDERVAVRDLGRLAVEARRASPTLDISYALNVPPGDAPLTASLAVGIPEDARGIYVARLRVTDTATGRTAVAERPFFVRA